MSTTTPNSLRCWRSIFLVLEAAVLVTFVGGWLAARFFHVIWEPEPEFLGIVLGVALLLSWLFLLIASPFFLKSLRWVALADWVIGFGILLMGMLAPAL